MKPSTGRSADIFGDIGSEGDDIVIEGALKFLAAFEVKTGARFHLAQVPLGDQALLGERFAGQQLDAQPNFQFSLFAPDFAHRRPRITLYHERTLETASRDVEDGLKELNSCAPSFCAPFRGFSVRVR